MSEALAILIAAVLAAIISLITVGASIAIVALSNRLSSDAKSKEIKLLNFHKDRIDAVKTLYGLVVDLSFANNYLFYANSENWGHNEYKNALLIRELVCKEAHLFFAEECPN